MNVELRSFTDFKFGDRVANEPRTFRLAETFGPGCYAALMMLLRDRYLPSLLPAFARSVG